ncbi:hypothetical protein SCHPADRAFT_888998 [Schizopora paradoxa]|uniref:Uncharacterized protein n=1 Tax=Schizopora paradoxa TaxID=27342 RepID=A0A0H2RSJ4_9AGAM|nr:hypothetical protein SCHPADRAFT_888998 [Schizopora paradoxa]
MPVPKKLKLEFPLALKRGRLTAKDMEECLKVKPMARLPVPLVPKDGSMRFRPPRLHYGWPLDEPDILLQIAKEKNIPPRGRSKTTISPKEVLISNDDDRDEEEEEESEEEDEDENEDDDTEDDSEPCPPRFSLTTSWLRKDALNVVAQELGLVSEPYVHEVFFQEKGAVQMIAFTNNYELVDRPPKRSDVDELRKYFKFEGSPMWYLDTYYWTWNCERYWDLRCAHFVLSRTSERND